MNKIIWGLIIGPFFLVSCSSAPLKTEENFRGVVRTMIIEHRLKKGNRNIIFKDRSGAYKSTQETYSCLQNSMNNNVEVSITLYPGTFQIKECKND